MKQNTNPNDIRDDEIRIISQSAPQSSGGSEKDPKRFSRISIILMVIGVGLIAILTAARFFLSNSDA